VGTSRAAPKLRASKHLHSCHFSFETPTAQFSCHSLSYSSSNCGPNLCCSRASPHRHTRPAFVVEDNFVVEGGSLVTMHLCWMPITLDTLAEPQKGGGFSRTAHFSNPSPAQGAAPGPTCFPARLSRTPNGKGKKVGRGKATKSIGETDAK
jgi:hypothetical protein